jgi:hypothetical protein
MRVGPGNVDELKNGVGGHDYAPFVVEPSLRREIQCPGESFDTMLSIEILADFADSLDERSVSAHVCQFCFGNLPIEYLSEALR